MDATGAGVRWLGEKTGSMVREHEAPARDSEMPLEGGAQAPGEA
jgi:hypothetical protein